jgi:ribonuclease HI
VDRDRATTAGGEVGALEDVLRRFLNLKGASASVLLISPQGDHLKYVLQIDYNASNNGTEYEALIHGLRITVSLGIK